MVVSGMWLAGLVGSLLPRAAPLTCTFPTHQSATQQPAGNFSLTCGPAMASPIAASVRPPTSLPPVDCCSQLGA